MSKKIELSGTQSSHLLITDTVSGVEEFFFTTPDIYVQDVVGSNLTAFYFDGVYYESYDWNDMVDSGDTPIVSKAALISFVRDNTGFNSASGGSGATIVYKSADESRTNDSSTSLDSELFAPVVTGGTYSAEAYIRCTAGSTTPDLRVRIFTSASSIDLTFDSMVVDSPNTNPTPILELGMNGSKKFDLTTGSSVVIIKATFTATADDNVGVSWSQFASDASATTIRKGSVFTITKIN